MGQKENEIDRQAAHQRAEQESQRAEQESQRAEQEHQARLAAEAEIARLRELLDQINAKQK